MLRFAAGRDPVEAIIESARSVTTSAMDRGWSGPPFDILALAEILDVRVIPDGDVRDARVTTDETGHFVVEVNPLRPKVRQRFSVAHEIAHTLFPDCGAAIRNRALHTETNDAGWELEALCNIAASELLMPAGAMPEDAREGRIDEALAIRSSFEVSAEAVLIRTVQLSRSPIAMFSATRIERGTNDGRYRLDYAIEAQNWDGEDLEVGTLLPPGSPVVACSGIGFTQKGPALFGGVDTRVECVGVMAYPGFTYPRVVGFLSRPGSSETEALTYLRGDAVEPDRRGVRIVAFLTNDGTANWGGGFARQVATSKPEVQSEFRKLVRRDRNELRLGSAPLLRSDDRLYYVPIIGQAGYGRAEAPRIRYEALANGLKTVGIHAQRLRASVHMPRIGDGASGGNWGVVREMIEEYVSPLAEVFVYDLPRTKTRAASVAS